MKLIEAVALNGVLLQISEASSASPKDFPMLVKLVVAENLRKISPFAQDHEKQRSALVTQHGKISEDARMWNVIPENMEKFAFDMQELGDHEIDPRLRSMRESDLGSSPLTVDQLSLLQSVGVILPNGQ